MPQSMINNCVRYKSIDEYISCQTDEIQPLLHGMRQIITRAAPEAKEKISYGMPAFEQHGIVVYFAVHRNHIGFYPTASGIAKFKDHLAGYRFSKGSVQFPLNEPLPADLIGQIVSFRVNENQLKYQAKKKK